MTVVFIMKFLKNIPFSLLVPAAILLGLAPFMPAPHLLQKIDMLTSGSLIRFVDIFDLFLHSSLGVMLLLKIACRGKE